MGLIIGELNVHDEKCNISFINVPENLEKRILQEAKENKRSSTKECISLLIHAIKERQGYNSMEDFCRYNSGEGY
jgi:hypothetical protein